MAGKELTFKLVMEADTKDFDAGTKVSKDNWDSFISLLKKEAEGLKAASGETAKEVGKIVPDDLQKKADQAASKIDDLGNELQNTAAKANRAGVEIGDAIPGDAVQLAEKLGSQFFTAAKEIEALGDKSVISAGELRSMSSAGEQGLAELNSALKTAQAELVRLQSTDGTLKDIEIAKERVLSIEDAIKETTSAFNYYQDVAVNAMRGVDNATQSSINQIQRFSAVDLSSVVGEAQTATRAIESMGDGANLSTKEIERIGNIGTNSINTLEGELQAARNAFSALEKSSEAVTLEEIKAAGDKVKGLEQAVDLTKTAFSDFDKKASASMRGVTDSTDKASNSAKQAGHEIYEALGIKPPTVVNDAITALTQKLEDFKANSKLPAEEIARVTKITEQEIEKLKGELDQTNKKLDESSSASDRAKVGFTSFKAAVGTLAAGLAALGLGLTVKELIATSDATQQMAARLRNATDSTDEYNLVQGRLLELANATYRPIQEAQEVYLATAGTMKSLGYSTEEVLAATESLSLSFTHNATRADQAQSAQDALSKSMAKGSVDADAWMSIITGADNVVKDMAVSTGKTEAEIRKLGAEGKASLSDLVNALIQSRDKNLELANSMENSTADAMQKVRNNLTALIAKMNEQFDVSSRLAGVIGGLGDNLQWIEILFSDVMAAIDGLSASFDDVDPSIFVSFKDAISSAYDAVKELAGTVYEFGTDVLDILNATLVNTLSIFSSFTGEATEAGEQVSFLERIFQGISITLGFVSDGLTAIKISLKLLTGLFFEFAAAANSAMAAVTWGDVSKQFAANADTMKAKAKEYYADADKEAMAFQSKGMARLAEAAKTEEEKNAESVAASRAKLEQLLSDQDKEVEGKKVSEAEKLKAVQQYAEAAIKANGGVVDGVMQADLLTKGYIVTVDEAGKVGVKAWGATAEAAKQSAEEQKLVARAFTEASEVAGRFGIDLDAALNRVSKTFSSSGNDVDEFARRLESAGVTGEQASNALYLGWKKWLETAKSQAEIDAANAKLREFEAQGVFSTKQVELGIMAIRNANANLPDELDETGKAFERLGIKTKEQLKLSAQQALMDYNTIRNSGQATAEGIEQAHKKAAQAVALSGDAGVIAAFNAADATQKLQVQIDETGKASVQAMDQLTKANNRVGDSARRIGDGYREAGRIAREEAKSSSEAWEEALTVMRGKLEASKTGTTGKFGFSVDEIKQKLLDMGFDEQRAKSEAKKLFKDAEPVAGGYYRTASNEWMKSKYGISAYDNQKALGNAMYVMEQLEKMEEYSSKSRSSSSTGTTPKVVDINSLAPEISYPKVNVPSSEPTYSARFEFILEGKKVAMYGAPEAGNAMEQMLRELEMLKKGS